MTSGNDIAWYFWCLQLWNSEERVRVDLSFPNVRFYKFLPEYGLSFKTAPLHCGLAPMYAYQQGSQSHHYFKHYGLMNKADRARKVARYNKYDPNEKWKGHSWYAALRNEKVDGDPIEDVIARLPESISKKKPLKPMNDHGKKTFMFRNKWGKAVPAVGEKQRGEFLKRGLVELPSLNQNVGAEAPVVPTPSVPVEPTASAADQKPKKTRTKKTK